MRFLLDNLPRINQRSEVKTDDIHLQFDSIVVVNHGTNDSILNFAVMQVHADFVTDRELALWFLGWHARTVRRVRECFQDAGLTQAVGAGAMPRQTCTHVNLEVSCL